MNRIANITMFCLLISALLAVYMDDKRWLAIAAVALSLPLVGLATFSVVLIRSQPSITKKPRLAIAFFVLIIGTYALGLPAGLLYILFR